MWKNLNKLTTKLFRLQKSKGTTIVEVLIAVIIIGIVSMYGLSFFSSSYKYEVDSKDYDLILQNLVRQMEIAKGAEYQHENATGFINSKERDYPGGIIGPGGNSSASLYFKNFNFLSKGAKVELRNGCSVSYGYKEYENLHGGEKFYGSTKLVCEAEWPEEIADDKRNKITLVTYVADRWEVYNGL